MTVTCSQCGEQWARDPALAVPCPACLAPVGRRCRRPSGHDCAVHASRDQAAMAAGFLRMCPKASSTHGTEPLQGSLFEFLPS